MPVDGEGARPLRRFVEGRELAGHLQAQGVEGLGMDVAGGGMVRQQRLAPVEEQQDQEVGEIADPFCLAGAGDELGIVLAAMVKQADELGQEAGQRRCRRADHAGRYVLVVEDDALVGLDLDDAGDPEADISGAFLGLQHEPQSQAADAQARHALDAGVGVGRFIFDRAVAGGSLVLAVGGELEAPRLAHRQRQIDHAVARVLRQIEGRRVIDVFGNVERRAVLQNAAAGSHGEAAGGQQLAVDLQFGESPGMGPEAVDASAHQPLDIAVILLEVLGTEEHALRPDDLVVPGHDSIHRRRVRERRHHDPPPDGRTATSTFRPLTDIWTWLV